MVAYAGQLMNKKSFLNYKSFHSSQPNWSFNRSTMFTMFTTKTLTSHIIPDTFGEI